MNYEKIYKICECSLLNKIYSEPISIRGKHVFLIFSFVFSFCVRICVESVPVFHFLVVLKLCANSRWTGRRFALSVLLVVHTFVVVINDFLYDDWTVVRFSFQVVIAAVVLFILCFFMWRGDRSISFLKCRKAWYTRVEWLSALRYCFLLFLLWRLLLMLLKLLLYFFLKLVKFWSITIRLWDYPCVRGVAGHWAEIFICLLFARSSFLVQQKRRQFALHDEFTLFDEFYKLLYLSQGLFLYGNRLWDNIQKLDHSVFFPQILNQFFVIKSLLFWCSKHLVNTLELWINLDFLLHIPSKKHSHILKLSLKVYFLYFHWTRTKPRRSRLCMLWYLRTNVF